MPRFYQRASNYDYDKGETDDFYRNPIKTFLNWKAASRPFRKKDRSYFTTIATLVVLLILISLLFGELLLAGVLLALGFVAYVLGFVPPEDVEYKISTQGVTIGDHFYFWQDLDSFWFGQRDGSKMLHVLTRFRFPGELMVVLDGQDVERVKTIVARYLPYHEIPPKTLLDKWSEALQKHFPLETPHH